MARKRKGLPVDGVLLLDKPFSLSSNHALQKIRRLLTAQKAGHSGCLDPYATGLLPLCFGEATKICQYLLGHDKTYEVEIHFGVETDSGDKQGEITSTKDVDVSLDQIKQALNKFTGEIAQVPPMFSALKKNGQPLYKLARKGVVIEREARRVHAYSLDIESWQSPFLKLNVSCSSGFYIRSLAIDLGNELGCGGHVSALRRTKVGEFDIHNAISIEAFEELQPLQRVEHLIRPDLVLDYPEIQLTALQAEKFLLGQAIDLENMQVENDAEQLYRVYADTSAFIGLAQIVDGLLKVKRGFRLTAPESLFGE